MMNLQFDRGGQEFAAVPTDGARSPGLLSRRVTSLEVASSRTSRSPVASRNPSRLLANCGAAIPANRVVPARCVRSEHRAS